MLSVIVLTEALVGMINPVLRYLNCELDQTLLAILLHKVRKEQFIYSLCMSACPYVCNLV
jgi:hypothetical protein